MANYYLYKNLGKTDFNEALEKFTAVAKENGFGVLTDLDLKEIFKKKIDKDINRYRLLGICNPNLAFKAVTAETSVGVFLPCSVVIAENNSGEVEVFIMNPQLALDMIDNQAVKEVGSEANSRLQKIIESL